MMQLRLVSALLLSGSVVTMALATECDQFTLRDVYEATLPDSIDRVNAQTNAFLDLAVEDYNLRFRSAQKQPDDSEREGYLALMIHNVMARENRLFLPQEEEAVPPELTLVRAFSKVGRGPLQSWLENRSDQGSYVLTIRDNIYRDIYLPGFNEAQVMKINGVLTGTDKIDHFFDQGYEYWLVSRHGRDDQAAIDYGVGTEWGWYGVAIDGVFSFGDLRANWKGYQFFKELSHYFSFEDDGSLERVATFDWRTWIDWQFDELLNPSYYAPALHTRIRDILRAQELSFERGESTSSPLRTWVALAGRVPAEQARGDRSEEYLNTRVPSDFPLLFDLAGLFDPAQEALARKPGSEPDQASFTNRMTLSGPPTN
jgi:hypothetical protein